MNDIHTGLSRSVGERVNRATDSREYIPEPMNGSGIELAIMNLESSLSDLYKTIDTLELKLAPFRICVPYNTKDACLPEKVASPINNKISDSCSAVRRIEDRIQNLIREIDL
jgi:hypothetical protein